MIIESLQRISLSAIIVLWKKWEVIKMINKSALGFVILITMVTLLGLACSVLPITGIVFLIIGIIKVVKYKKEKNENKEQADIIKKQMKHSFIWAGGCVLLSIILWLIVAIYFDFAFASVSKCF